MMRSAALWKARFLTISMGLFFCVLSEWLFFATKPSFLSAASWPQKIGVLFTTAALPLLLFGFLHLVLWLLRLERAGRYLLLITAAAIVGSFLLLMVDNFTVTLFGFGIRSFEFPKTIVYIVLLAFLCFLSFRWLARTEKKIANANPRVLSICVIVVLTCAFLLVLNRYIAGRSLLQYESTSASKQKLPNILFIGSDGINADHMGIYGYEKNTTPFISSFAQSALICTNAYANASRTLASLVSMLTGKLPIDTRITCPPDILRGENGYQHLPGILKRHGYRSIQMSVRDYGDAIDANMRMAFDMVNFRRADELALFELTGPFLDQDSAYLLYQSYDRLSQRILHIFGLTKMPDSLAEVLGKKRETFPDSDRIKKLLKFIDASPQPFFAHVHLMSTHKNRIKSASSEKGWIVPDVIPPVYDDGVQRFDRYFQQVVEHLDRAGKLESTIVVLYSDHGWKHATKFRVPLVIRFPNGAHAGQIADMVQNIDIAPTILEYLNLAKPGWMSGQSLLSQKIEACRPVLSVWPVPMFDQQQNKKVPVEAKAPFYTLGAVSVVTCNNYYKYDLERRRLITERLENADCSRCKPYTKLQVIGYIVKRLTASGYDTSSLH